MRFQDQVVIVSGGASGIGLAIGQRFVDEGARLLIADINAQQGEAAVQQLQAQHSWPGRVRFCRCDVGDEGEVEAAVQSALQAFGRLDVVVNNAGLMQFRPLVQLGADDWLSILRVDLLGAFYFIKQAMLHARVGGAVVNIASIHALETEPMVAPYAAAKAALLSLTRSAALENERCRLRINAVLPGAVDTPMLWTNPNVRSGEEKLSASEIGRPEDIAAAVAFLASADAAFIHGATLTIDGGRLAHL